MNSEVNDWELNQASSTPQGTPGLNSPIIHPSYIDFQTKEQTPVETSMDVSGSMSLPGVKMADDLQGLLDQFDPLTIGDKKGQDEGCEMKTNEHGINDSEDCQEDSVSHSVDCKVEQVGHEAHKDVKQNQPPNRNTGTAKSSNNIFSSSDVSNIEGEISIAGTPTSPNKISSGLIANNIEGETSIPGTPKSPNKISSGLIANNIEGETSIPGTPKSSNKISNNLDVDNLEGVSSTPKPSIKTHKHKKSASRSKIEKTHMGLPIPEEELPFDFQRFLDQLRHKSADPIARYVKSFLTEFNKRPWTANEQVKIVGDFKAFIASKMDSCAPFSTLSDHEMKNALEGMEKLLMNRLYHKTFSPEIKPELRSDLHEEDILRDKILSEKMRIWHWIQGRHLDVADKFLRNGDAFVKLASDELLKINNYRAPRDKVICILNCCKVIFGLLRQTDSEESADAFLPILIYVLLKAQPPDLISNVNYIQRFRNPDMLNGEAGYYLSSILGAISFIETLDRSNLSITAQEFETNVESSVKSIAEPPVLARSLSSLSSQPPSTPGRIPSPLNPDHSTTKGTNVPVITKPTRKYEGDLEDPESTQLSQSGSLDNPMSNEGQTQSERSRPVSPTVPGLNTSSVLYNSAGIFSAPFKTLSKLFEAQPSNDSKEETMTPEESAARQASAEEHEAQRIQQMEFENVSATLKQMFPVLDKEVIDDILREKQGRVGSAVDVCLAMVG